MLKYNGHHHELSDPKLFSNFVLECDIPIKLDLYLHEHDEQHIVTSVPFERASACHSQEPGFTSGVWWALC